jgi:hypothetical protein
MDPEAVWFQTLSKSRGCMDPEAVWIQRLSKSRGCMDPEAVWIQRLSGYSRADLNLLLPPRPPPIHIKRMIITE